YPMTLYNKAYFTGIPVQCTETHDAKDTAYAGKVAVDLPIAQTPVRMDAVDAVFYESRLGLHGVPVESVQKTTILWKRLYLLALSGGGWWSMRKTLVCLLVALLLLCGVQVAWA